VPNFSVRALKCNEKNVAEEYCWAITQAAGRSCLQPIGFRFGAWVYTQLTLYTYMYKHMYVFVYIHIQGVSGRIVNILGGGSMDSSE
jgi:hypothetical protein